MGCRAAARSWWVESETSPSKQPPGEGYAASDDNRCFLIDEGGGETSGDLQEPLVSHGQGGDSSGAGFRCPGSQCLNPSSVAPGTGVSLLQLCQEFTNAKEDKAGF